MNDQGFNGERDLVITQTGLIIVLSVVGLFLLAAILGG